MNRRHRSVLPSILMLVHCPACILLLAVAVFFNGTSWGREVSVTQGENPGGSSKPAPAPPRQFEKLLRPDGLAVEYYLRRYPDAQKVSEGEPQKAASHYFRHGIREGRSPNPFFDPEYYLRHNGDLQKAFGPKGYEAAAEHWAKKGIYEGRRGSPLFDPKYYLSANKDVAKECGAENYLGAYAHYVEKGAAEERQPMREKDWSKEDRECVLAMSEGVAALSVPIPNPYVLTAVFVISVVKIVHSCPMMGNAISFSDMKAPESGSGTGSGTSSTGEVTDRTPNAPPTSKPPKTPDQPKGPSNPNTPAQPKGPPNPRTPDQPKGPPALRTPASGATNDAESGNGKAETKGEAGQP